MKFGMKLTATEAVFTVDGVPLSPEDVLSTQIVVELGKIPHVVLAVRLTEVEVDLAAASIAKVPVAADASLASAPKK